MKFGINHYWKPTPKTVRKFADALLASSTFISASSILINYPKVAVFSVILGASAKFISNFFGEDN